MHCNRQLKNKMTMDGRRSWEGRSQNLFTLPMKYYDYTKLTLLAFIFFRLQTYFINKVKNCFVTTSLLLCFAATEKDTHTIIMCALFFRSGRLIFMLYVCLFFKFVQTDNTSHIGSELHTVEESSDQS